MWSLQNLLFTICIALICVSSAVGVIHVTGYMGSKVEISCSYDKGFQAKMWSLQNFLLTICIALICVTSAVGVIHVTGYLGSEVKISCSYGPGYQSYQKYLCRNDCGSGDVLITTSNPVKNKHRIHDDKTARIFTTTISDLHSTDAGKYWCGVTRNWKDIYTEVKLELVPDSCCNSVTKIESYAGYSVSFSCPYESRYQNNLKYICRGTRPSMCLQQALITSYNKENGRFRLNDENMSTKFTTKISSLTQSDSGRYLCGIQRNSDLHLFCAFELKVKDHCCDTVTNIESYEGYSESINCPYENQYQNSLKYICRGNQPSTCLQDALITSNNRENGRFRLNDVKMSRIFTVTISSLTQSDSGHYLCGVQTNSDHDVFSAVELQVKEWCCVTSTEITGTVGQPLTLQCPYPSQHRDNRKFLCKGDHRNSCRDMVMSKSRFALQGGIYSNSFSVTITKLEEADAGTYWCGSDSQWRVGNYTKIQLSVVFLQHTSTVPSTVKPPGKTVPPTVENLVKSITSTMKALGKTQKQTPSQPIKDSTLYVLFAVPPVLLSLIGILVVVVYKWKHHKVKEDETTVDRNAPKAEGLEEVMGAMESNIYGNQEVVMYSKKQTSKQQSACAQYEDEEQDYENFTIFEDIYCNENFHKANRK
ncbi:polymeric immunoglobulin receptor-like [Simochromis diagramma]|uniref:polymeric immunoglobulin receptor-like n=1 Tax=Simochromis diagramma TaxID=43689 RepID=UPI001A7E908F|nr:polymeric immunoglobulin receptor-like [Simochromis diagramma]